MIHVQEVAQLSNIVLFSKDACPGCATVKDFLKNQGHSYALKDVGKDPMARIGLMENGFMSVPVAQIDGEFFAGPESIIKRLKEN